MLSAVKKSLKIGLGIALLFLITNQQRLVHAVAIHGSLAPISHANNPSHTNIVIDNRTNPANHHQAPFKSSPIKSAQDVQSGSNSVKSPSGTTVAATTVSSAKVSISGHIDVSSHLINNITSHPHGLTALPLVTIANENMHTQLLNNHRLTQPKAPHVVANLATKQAYHPHSFLDNQSWHSLVNEYGIPVGGSAAVISAFILLFNYRVRKWLLTKLFKPATLKGKALNT